MISDATSSSPRHDFAYNLPKTAEIVTCCSSSSPFRGQIADHDLLIHKFLQEHSHYFALILSKFLPSKEFAYRGDPNVVSIVDFIGNSPCSELPKSNIEFEL